MYKQVYIYICVCVCVCVCVCKYIWFICLTPYKLLIVYLKPRFDSFIK